MRQVLLDELQGARTAPELMSAVENAAAELDFGLVAMVMRQGSLNANPHIKSVSNHPKEWLEMSATLDYAVVDPVFVRLQNSIEPFFYDQDFYHRAGCAETWEMIAPYGFANGVNASMPLPGGKRLFWGFDRRSALPTNERKRTHLLAVTQLIGVFAAAAADRILGRAQPLLTDTQLAILRFTWQGHAVYAISRFIKTSEDNVNYHLKKIRAKLGVSSKHQAVLKALSLGLLGE